MYHLRKPQYDQKGIVEDCIPKTFRESQYRDRAERIRGYIQKILDDTRTYDERAEKGQLYLVEENDCSNEANRILKEDMEYLYTERFVKSKKDAYYAAIMKDVMLCPFCGQPFGTGLKQLDHFLPKALFPVYAVSPINLVPCCGRCNNLKSAYAPKDKFTQIIHPYYDDYNDKEIWIKAKLEEYKVGKEVQFRFTFFCSFPKNWTEEKREKAKSHFSLFHLEKRFSEAAIQVFMHCRELVKRVTFARDWKELRNAIRTSVDYSSTASFFGAQNSVHYVAVRALFDESEVSDNYWKVVWRKKTILL